MWRIAANPKDIPFGTTFDGASSDHPGYFWKIHVFLKRVTLELTVCDYDRIGTSDPIGKVSLGYNRKGAELKHWKEMVENPRRPVIHWHVLKVKKKSPVLPVFWENSAQIYAYFRPCNQHDVGKYWVNFAHILSYQFSPRYQCFL